jgi:hypothetical protein
MKPKNKSEAEPRKARKDRYWSVMLVGEHGRIVPLKWFKGFFITFVALLMLAIGAAALLGFFYKQQAVEIDRLQNELRLIKDQAAKLRDEKDLYLTQFVASQKNNPPAVLKKEQPEPNDIPAPPKTGQQKPAQPPRKAPPAPAPKPKPATEAVQWKADIRRFAVTYDPDREVLKAQFRIYNTSKPKRPLAGRSVVAFKEMDTSPLKWFTVPRVPISEGKPDGAMGQAFKINNYRTMTFRAYQQKIPVTYDTASVFVFSADGKLITERDFAFHIDAKPPAVAPSAVQPPAAPPSTIQAPAAPPSPIQAPAAPPSPIQAPAAPPSTIQAPAALPSTIQPPAAPPSIVKPPAPAVSPAEVGPSSDQIKPAPEEVEGPAARMSPPGETTPQPNQPPAPGVEEDAPEAPGKDLVGGNAPSPQSPSEDATKPESEKEQQ